MLRLCPTHGRSGSPGVNGAVGWLWTLAFCVMIGGDSKLVVDGSSLAHHLYKLANLDQNHGGEYLAFQAEVQAFFKTLDNCQIKAYVVIDGGSGASDKLTHRMDRQRTRVKKIPDALKGGKRDFYALFTTTVFEQTLNNMKVPLVRCFGEADGQLAALAREWCCPVLSGDTDFYIYDLPEGVLPLHHYQWDSVKPSGARSYISCKRYTMSKFCVLQHRPPAAARLRRFGRERL
ncbi:unnamed protein product [Arctogadus glacialis]